MRRHVGDAAQPQIGQWADRERDLLAGDPRRELGILERPVAVIDALDPQQIERLADIVGRPLFPRMRDRVQAKPAGTGEDALELRRWMAVLRRVEADADDAVAPRQCLIERSLRTRLIKMSQEAQDQRRGEAKLALGVAQRTPQAVDQGLERAPALGVALRIEE